MVDRTLMRCDNCGRGYAAWRLDDGTVHLLGGNDVCERGHTSFSEMVRGEEL